MTGLEAAGGVGGVGGVAAQPARALGRHALSALDLVASGDVRIEVTEEYGLGEAVLRVLSARPAFEDEALRADGGPGA
ncbi:hypothetical protein [Streptomyces sp. NPDC001536]|uniref:hypothetical protein n=1 Tax=Streptomyces sp. NPDC001536 TaxID=3364583 RepID=UPI0036C0809A